MTDYNEILGHKYRGVWVTDLSIEELLQIEPRDLNMLRLSEKQKEDLKVYRATNNEDYQDQLAAEYKNVKK